MTSKHAFLLSTFVGAVGMLTACSSDRKVSASPPEIVRNVAVTTAHTANVPDLLEAVGTVHAAQASELASRVVGTIVQVRVREGDSVRRGQVLVIIDDRESIAAVNRATAGETAAQQEVAAAESELALAESTLKRYQNLLEKKSVSPQEFDEVKTRQQAALAHKDLARASLEQAKAALAQARTALEYTQVRAPFDGVVTERKLDPGAMANPGSPVLAIEDTSRYRLEVAINENDLRYIVLRQAAPVRIDALGPFEIKGRVAQVVPAADPVSRTFLVKIDLPGQRQLRSGLFGRAQFSRGEKPALTVPQTAVIQRGQLQGVYVLNDTDLASLRYVTLGKQDGTQVEILAGLQDGDRVISHPGELELNGKRVEMKP
jgi:RND family efflux transporter MFP subunit